MKDACTQTDRSDYQKIKFAQMKMMQQMKEQQARLKLQEKNNLKSPGTLVQKSDIKNLP